jgi:SagB-type dehydrogenase family enzyme
MRDGIVRWNCANELRSSIVATLLASSIAGCIDVTGANRHVPNAGESIELPAPSREGDVAVERALAERRSVRDYAEVPLPLAALAQLAWAAQGVTHASGYRAAPSAGALYPLELYVVAGDVPGLEAGIYHYVPAEHRLVRHAGGDPRGAVARAALFQSWIGAAKYGDRALRYVHMEVGHAAQNVYLQTEALGLGTCMVGAFHDGQLKRVLALPEAAVPLALLPVGTPR